MQVKGSVGQTRKVTVRVRPHVGSYRSHYRFDLITMGHVIK